LWGLRRPRDLPWANRKDPALRVRGIAELLAEMKRPPVRAAINVYDLYLLLSTSAH